MSEHFTEPYEPEDPDSSYEWDFEGERAGGPKVLWGRIIALGVVIIIAFLIGSATGGGGGVSQADFDDLAAENEDLQAEVDGLQEQLQEALAEDDDTVNPTPTAAPTEEAPAEGETYVVQKGDNLRLIAEKFYEDVGLDDCIAEANDIEDPTQLSVGQELIIPPKESCA